MHSRDDRPAGSDLHPQGGALESPFLHEEFFVQENDAEWEASLAELEAETPFRRALEQNRTILIEPAELKEELVTESVPTWERDEFQEEEAEGVNEETLAGLEGRDEEHYGEESSFTEGTEEASSDVGAPQERQSYEAAETRIEQGEGEDTSPLEETQDSYLEVTEFLPDTEVAPPALSQAQRAWIFALDRSAIERVPDAEARRRFLEEIDWSRVEFPGNGPSAPAVQANWKLADNLFSAMAAVTPERRVPTSIRFRDVDRVVVAVPGQAGQKLYLEARNSFMRMRDAAAADAVQLHITSSWRSRQRQAQIRERQPNPKAVARLSAHMYGLAVDLRLSVPGLSIGEANTRTQEKMANIVRMYRSPVYKWMALRAGEFGWFPYRREPWHWEYNPLGLKERFEGSASPTGLTVPTTVDPARPEPTQSGSPQPAAPIAVGSISSLPRQLADAVRNGLLTLQVALAMLSGGRDENQLTNMIFIARHSERLPTQKIQPHEKQLSREWLDIRDRIVRPTLNSLRGQPASRTLPAPPSGSMADWAQVDPSQRMRYVMELLVNKYQYPVSGAAGLVGNLWAESAVLPNRIEGSAATSPMRAPNLSGVITDFTAEQVMNRNVAAHLGPKRPGIGLAQWTSASRRAGLFAHSFQGRVLAADILGNMDAQVDYLVTELQAKYGRVDSLLRNLGTSLESASDEVVYSFEIPGSILTPGDQRPRHRLPRDHSAVQNVFARRRGYSRNALQAYRAAHPEGYVASEFAESADQYELETTIGDNDLEIESFWEVDEEVESAAGDDDANDRFEVSELDPSVLDIAEKTIAREVPLFEGQVSSRWTRCFSAIDVTKVERAYRDNASAASANHVDRCSCIVMLNVALGQLLSLPLEAHRARGASTRIVQTGDLTTESIEKAMRQLRNTGYAVAPTVMNFFDRRGRTAGTLKPERLKSSVQAKVLALAESQGCWFAFGLSIMDGYHSVLLLVDRTTANAKIYWLDQFSGGLTDDVTSSLDQRITDKTRAWWQAVMDAKGKGYNTTIRLWPLRKRR